MSKKTLIFIFMILCVFGATTFAKSFDELLRLAVEDTLPEVREAAALALIQIWVDSKQTDEDLRQLALASASSETRHAAARALGLRLVRAAKDQNEVLMLMDLGEFSEVQTVAAERLSQLLLEETMITLDELIRTVSIPNNSRLRGAAVPALSAAWRNAPISIEALLANTLAGETVEFRAAAARALILKLQNSFVYVLGETALFDLSSDSLATLDGAVAGANSKLRNAAAALLQERLKESDPGLDDLRLLAGDVEVFPALRAAAAAALAEKLLGANLTLAELEAIATGPTPELRSSAAAALLQAIVAALGRLELTLAALTQSVATAASVELAKIRADAVFVLLRASLVALETQSDLEAIANGQTIVIRGITLDGSLAAYRLVASEFLTGIYTFFGFIDRFENPLEQLTAIAEDESLTPAFRAAAGRALTLVFRAEPNRNLQTLSELAQLLDEVNRLATQNDIEGALQTLVRFRTQLDAERDSIILTAEVAGDFTVRRQLNDEVNRAIAGAEQSLKSARLITFRSELSAIRRVFQAIERSVAAAPNVGEAALKQIAATGATQELRQAAGQALSVRLLRDESNFDVLLTLAGDGASAAARQAAIPALAQMWAENAGLDQLYQQALTGASAAIRLAAARALVESSVLTGFSTEQLLEFVGGQAVAVAPLLIAATNVELQLAAATALAKLWADSDSPSLDELIELATGETTTALQIAAANALSQRLITAQLGEGELFNLISDHTLVFASSLKSSQALSDALARALADHFASTVFP